MQISASQFAAHPAGHALTRDPDQCWLSTGLFPQLLTVDFAHDVQLEGITVQASGAAAIEVLLHHSQSGAGSGGGRGGQATNPRLRFSSSSPSSSSFSSGLLEFEE